MGTVANLAQPRAILLASLLVLNGCKEIVEDQAQDEFATEEAVTSPGQPDPTLPSTTPFPTTPAPNPQPTPTPTTTLSSPITLDVEGSSKFLMQATFGASMPEIEELAGSNVSQWFIDQTEIPATLALDVLLHKQSSGQDLKLHSASDLFWEAAVSGPDQLRQRMAFALSQILVVSDDFSSDLRNQPLAMAYYMDILTRNAFGNYRDLLEEVTYSPAMALYLSYMRNQGADPDTGRFPDENYAREIMQLFTIGLVELNSDGSPKPGAPETYTIEDIMGLARVFTGLSERGGWGRGEAAVNGFYSPLVTYPEFHSTQEKSFLGTTIPAGTSVEDSIDMALDTLVSHPNVGPFIGHRLIQRFVTSNPTPAYVQRVATAFDTGSFVLPDGQPIGDGRRGDLGATLAAVLFDVEARQPADHVAADFGKMREPILRFLQWSRAFKIADASADEKTALANTSASVSLGQHPYKSPSVFNFYRPGYVANGTTTASVNLAAPEFQIVSESSIVGYANFMGSFVRDNTGNVTGSSGDAFRPDYSQELTFANDPEALVEHLDLLLTYGSMGNVEKNRIIAALNEMPIRDDANQDEDLERRVHLAVQMTVTSAAYSIQK